MKMKKVSPLYISCRYERRDIYVITYLPTGKKYVGKSRDVRIRFDCHYYSLRGHRHSVADFQRDYDKYGGGREAFKVEIIDCQLPFFSDRYDPEHFAMIQLKTYDGKYGYNTHDHMVQWIREKEGLPVILSGWQKKKGNGMKVLIACEESQTVCKAFRAKGHEAYSCDIIEPSGGHPEWHIKGDVLPLLSGHCSFYTQDGTWHHIYQKWDMIIAFPPCTHLAVSGAAWFSKKREDGRQRWGIEFFANFLQADCKRVAIENPVGIISGGYIPKWFPDLAEKYHFPIRPTQIVHPWNFGDNYSKQTCLWLKGLNPLIPKITEQPELEWFEWVDGKTGKKKRQPKWFADAWHLKPTERAKVRSKTFPGIAQAMADQWG